jgi:hypothetical protein
VSPLPAAGHAVWTPPRLLVAAALALFGALALLVFDPRLFAGGDNAVYYLLGKALASGRGYVTLYEPGDPPHSLYPPGYPILLVPIFWLFGGSFVAGKALSLLASLAALALAARVLARRLDPESARRGAFAFALFLLAVNPTAIAYSHWMLSEMPFLAVSLGALVLAESGADRRRAWVGAALLAAAAYLIRTAALPLGMAVAWAAWRVRGWRAGLGSLAICLAAVVGWELRNHIVAPDQPGYLTQLLMVNSYYPQMGMLTPATFVARALSNLGEYAFLEIPRLVWPFVPGLGVEPPSRAYLLGALLVSLMVFGLFRQVRRRGVRAGEVYAGLYAGILMSWQWQGERFLLPVAPLLLSYLGVGIVDLARVVARGRGDAASTSRRGLAGGDVGRAGWLGAALVGLAVAPHLVFSLRAVPEQLAVTAAHLRGDRLAGYEPTVRDYFAASIWLGENSPPDAVVVSRKPMFTYLLGGRKSVLYPYGPPEEIERAVRAADARYLIYDQLGNSAAVYLTPYLLDYQQDYRLEHQEGDPPTLVLSRVAGR